jgi:hypothetical protein
MSDDLRRNWPSNMGERFAWGDQAQQRVIDWQREYNRQLTANNGDVGMATGMANSVMGYSQREAAPANMEGHFQPERMVIFPSQAVPVGRIASRQGSPVSRIASRQGSPVSRRSSIQANPVQNNSQRRNIRNLEDVAPRTAPVSPSERREQEQYLRRVEGVPAVDQFGNLANVRYDSPNQGRSREPIERRNALPRADVPYELSVGEPSVTEPLQRRNALPRANTPYELSVSEPLQRRNALPRADAPYELSVVEPLARRNAGPRANTPYELSVTEPLQRRNALPRADAPYELSPEDSLSPVNDSPPRAMSPCYRPGGMPSNASCNSPVEAKAEELRNRNSERTAQALRKRQENQRERADNDFIKRSNRENFNFLLDNDFWRKNMTYGEIREKAENVWPRETGSGYSFHLDLPENRPDDDIETMQDYAVRVGKAVQEFISGPKYLESSMVAYNSIIKKVEDARNFANYYKTRYSDEYPTLIVYHDDDAGSSSSSLGTRAKNNLHSWLKEKQNKIAVNYNSLPQDSLLRRVGNAVDATGKAIIANPKTTAIGMCVVRLAVFYIKNFFGGNSKKTKSKHSRISKPFVQKVVKSVCKLVQKYNCNVEIDESKIDCDEIIRMANKMSIERINTELNNLKIEYNIITSNEIRKDCGNQIQLPDYKFVLSFINQDLKTHSRNKTLKNKTSKSRSMSMTKV